MNNKRALIKQKDTYFKELPRVCNSSDYTWDTAHLPNFLLLDNGSASGELRDLLFRRTSMVSNIAAIDLNAS